MCRRASRETHLTQWKRKEPLAAVAQRVGGVVPVAVAATQVARVAGRVERVARVVTVAVVAEVAGIVPSGCMRHG